MMNEKIICLTRVWGGKDPKMVGIFTLSAPSQNNLTEFVSVLFLYHTIVRLNMVSVHPDTDASVMKTTS